MSDKEMVSECVGIKPEKGPGRRRPRSACSRHRLPQWGKNGAHENLDDVMKKHKLGVVKSSFRAPNMNANVQWLIQTIQLEGTDHFVICGTKHLDDFCYEYWEHYQTKRPRQGLKNEAPAETKRHGRQSAVVKPP